MAGSINAERAKIGMLNPGRSASDIRPHLGHIKERKFTFTHVPEEAKAALQALTAHSDVDVQAEARAALAALGLPTSPQPQHDPQPGPTPDPTPDPQPQPAGRSAPPPPPGAVAAPSFSPVPASAAGISIRLSPAEAPISLQAFVDQLATPANRTRNLLMLTSGLITSQAGYEVLTYLSDKVVGELPITSLVSRSINALRAERDLIPADHQSDPPSMTEFSLPDDYSAIFKYKLEKKQPTDPDITRELTILDLLCMLETPTEVNLSYIAHAENHNNLWISLPPQILIQFQEKLVQVRMTSGLSDKQQEHIRTAMRGIERALAEEVVKYGAPCDPLPVFHVLPLKDLIPLARNADGSINASREDVLRRIIGKMTAFEISSDIGNIERAEDVFRAVNLCSPAIRDKLLRDDRQISLAYELVGTRNELAQRSAPFVNHNGTNCLHPEVRDYIIAHTAFTYYFFPNMPKSLSGLSTRGLLTSDIGLASDAVGRMRQSIGTLIAAAAANDARHAALSAQLDVLKPHMESAAAPLQPELARLTKNRDTLLKFIAGKAAIETWYEESTTRKAPYQLDGETQGDMAARLRSAKREGLTNDTIENQYLDRLCTAEESLGWEIVTPEAETSLPLKKLVLEIERDGESAVTSRYNPQIEGKKAAIEAAQSQEVPVAFPDPIGTQTVNLLQAYSDLSSSIEGNKKLHTIIAKEKAAVEESLNVLLAALRDYRQTMIELVDGALGRTAESVDPARSLPHPPPLPMSTS